MKKITKILIWTCVIALVILMGCKTTRRRRGDEDLRPPLMDRNSFTNFAISDLSDVCWLNTNE